MRLFRRTCIIKLLSRPGKPFLASLSRGAVSPRLHMLWHLVDTNCARRSFHNSGLFGLPKKENQEHGLKDRGKRTDTFYLLNMFVSAHNSKICDWLEQGDT